VALRERFQLSGLLFQARRKCAIADGARHGPQSSSILQQLKSALGFEGLFHSDCSSAGTSSDPLRSCQWRPLTEQMVATAFPALMSSTEKASWIATSSGSDLAPMLSGRAEGACALRKSDCAHFGENALRS
jgi:hypothetical protein